MSNKKKEEIIRDSISDLLMENDIDLSNDISGDTLTFQKILHIWSLCVYINKVCKLTVQLYELS